MNQAWKWTVSAWCLFVMIGPAVAEEKQPGDPTVAQTVMQGKLQTGVLAVGGETTGHILNASNRSVELDFADPKLQKKADGLDSKQVQVSGTLEKKPSAEAPERTILHVNQLEDIQETNPPAPKDVQPGEAKDSDQAAASVGLEVVSAYEAEAVVRTSGESRVIDVRSPTGIGRLELKRTGKHWPASLQVRLQIKEMESFYASSTVGEFSGYLTNRVEISARASWKSTGKQEDNYGKSKAEEALRFDADGFILIQLPPALFEGSPETISLHWINAYRR